MGTRTMDTQGTILAGMVEHRGRFISKSSNRHSAQKQIGLPTMKQVMVLGDCRMMTGKKTQSGIKKCSDRTACKTILAFKNATTVTNTQRSRLQSHGASHTRTLNTQMVISPNRLPANLHMVRICNNGDSGPWQNIQDARWKWKTNYISSIVRHQEQDNNGRQVSTRYKYGCGPKEQN